jgi:undecaprenyl-diphosphatase
MICAPSGRRQKALLSGALVSLVGYLTLGLLAAQQQLVVLDEGTRAWVQMLRQELPALPMDLVSVLGNDEGLIPLILLAMLVIWRMDRRWAVALPIVMCGTGALQYVAKWLADRPRPDATPWGFPSGHVLSLVVFFGLMVHLVSTATEHRRRWRLLACGVCAATVMAVAFSRLYLDRHWLSDVVGGLAVGTTYLLVVIWMVEISPAMASAASSRLRARAARRGHRWDASGRAG